MQVFKEYTLQLKKKKKKAKTLKTIIRKFTWRFGSTLGLLTIAKRPRSFVFVSQYPCRLLLFCSWYARLDNTELSATHNAHPPELNKTGIPGSSGYSKCFIQFTPSFLFDLLPECIMSTYSEDAACVTLSLLDAYISISFHIFSLSLVYSLSVSFAHITSSFTYPSILEVKENKYDA